MLDLDPPDHTRLRQLVHKAFTPRLIEQMRGQVQTLANELLDAVSRRGEMDLIRDYSLPLPMTIITEILGVPTRDRDKFHNTAPVFMSTERYASEDVTIQGVTIPRGGMTLGVIGSANRDETVFEKSDMLDITRENNRHLSFGQGVHYCLGAALARLESQIAINTLLNRMPDLHLNGAPESLRWRPGLILRGLERLPIGF